jgi:hypothetical protein
MERLLERARQNRARTDWSEIVALGCFHFTLTSSRLLCRGTGDLPVMTTSEFERKSVCSRWLSRPLQSQLTLMTLSFLQAAGDRWLILLDGYVLDVTEFSADHRACAFLSLVAKPAPSWC